MYVHFISIKIMEMFNTIWSSSFALSALLLYPLSYSPIISTSFSTTPSSALYKYSSSSFALPSLFPHPYPSPILYILPLPLSIPLPSALHPLPPPFTYLLGSPPLFYLSFPPSSTSLFHASFSFPLLSSFLTFPSLCLFSLGHSPSTHYLSPPPFSHPSPSPLPTTHPLFYLAPFTSPQFLWSWTVYKNCPRYNFL